MTTVWTSLSESPEIGVPGSGVVKHYGGPISDWERRLYGLSLQSSSLHLKGSEEAGTVIGFLAGPAHWRL